VTARIDSMKTAKVAGIKGKMAIAALETEAVSGEPVSLSGGYNKGGKKRMALSITLAAVVAWPLIFIKGKAAKLPAGTVFDSYTDGPLVLSVEDAAPPKALEVGSGEAFGVEILYDELEQQDKPRDLPILVTLSADPSGGLYIDRINGAEIPRLPMEIVSSEAVNEGVSIRALVGLKPLVKNFKPGINTFHVAYDSPSGRAGTEVILNIQI